MNKTKLNKEEIINKIRKIHPQLEVIELRSSQHVEIRDEFGICVVQLYSLLTGSKPTISSAIDKTEYYKNKLKILYPDITLLSDYKGSFERVRIMTKFGECNCIATSLLRGKPISIDVAINKSEYFKNLAREKHGDRYDYSKVKYISTENKVKIICKVHGEFEQNPHTHLKTYGCRKCSDETRSGGWHNNHKNINRASNFYILSLENEEESFLKFGVAVKLKSRISQIKRETKNEYTVKIIKVIEETVECCSKIENEFRQKVDLSTNNYIKYVPKIKFLGKHECFKLNV